MRHDFLDRYGRLDSAVHRLGPGVKLAAALALVAGVVALPRSWPLGLGAAALLLALVALLSRVPQRYLLSRVLLLEPVALGVAALALFQPGGWRLSLVLLGKSTVCIAAMVLLANTTPFADLLGVLKSWGMPALLVTTLSLMYRYLFVLVDEAQRMTRARASRTFSGRAGRTWGTAATVAGQLFIRASERAERIYAAMCARGWR